MKKPTLKLNKATGYYEGLLLVQVEPELFRRVLLKEVEDDEHADLTDPSTWAAAIARAGTIAHWLDKPHTKITPIDSVASIPEEKPVPRLPEPATKPIAPPAKKPDRHHQAAPRVFLADVEAKLREQARHIAPFLWEETLQASLEPVAHLNKHDRKKQRIFQLRFKQKRIIKALYAEWEAGNFQLDKEAEDAQLEHMLQEENKLGAKLETVAETVNNSRFH